MPSSNCTGSSSDGVSDVTFFPSPDCDPAFPVASQPRSMPTEQTRDKAVTGLMKGPHHAQEDSDTPGPRSVDVGAVTPADPRVPQSSASTSPSAKRAPIASDHSYASSLASYYERNLKKAREELDAGDAPAPYTAAPKVDGPPQPVVQNRMTMQHQINAMNNYNAFQAHHDAKSYKASKTSRDDPFLRDNLVFSRCDPSYVASQFESQRSRTPKSTTPYGNYYGPVAGVYSAAAPSRIHNPVPQKAESESLRETKYASTASPKFRTWHPESHSGMPGGWPAADQTQSSSTGNGARQDKDAMKPVPGPGSSMEGPNMSMEYVGQSCSKGSQARARQRTHAPPLPPQRRSKASKPPVSEPPAGDAEDSSIAPSENAAASSAASGISLSTNATSTAEKRPVPMLDLLKSPNTPAKEPHVSDGADKPSSTAQNVENICLNCHGTFGPGNEMLCDFCHAIFTRSSSTKVKKDHNEDSSALQSKTLESTAGAPKASPKIPWQESEEYRADMERLASYGWNILSRSKRPTVPGEQPASEFSLPEPAPAWMSDSMVTVFHQQQAAERSRQGLELLSQTKKPKQASDCTKAAKPPSSSNVPVSAICSTASASTPPVRAPSSQHNRSESRPNKSPEQTKNAFAEQVKRRVEEDKRREQQAAFRASSMIKEAQSPLETESATYKHMDEKNQSTTPKYESEKTPTSSHHRQLTRQDGEMRILQQQMLIHQQAPMKLISSQVQQHCQMQSDEQTQLPVTDEQRYKQLNARIPEGWTYFAPSPKTQVDAKLEHLDEKKTQSSPSLERQTQDLYKWILSAKNASAQQPGDTCTTFCPSTDSSSSHGEIQASNSPPFQERVKDHTSSPWSHPPKSKKYSSPSSPAAEPAKSSLVTIQEALDQIDASYASVFGNAGNSTIAKARIELHKEREATWKALASRAFPSGSPDEISTNKSYSLPEVLPGESAYSLAFDPERFPWSSSPARESSCSSPTLPEADQLQTAADEEGEYERRGARPHDIEANAKQNADEEQGRALFRELREAISAQTKKPPVIRERQQGSMVQGKHTAGKEPVASKTTSTPSPVESPSPRTSSAPKPSASNGSQSMNETIAKDRANFLPRMKRRLAADYAFKQHKALVEATNGEAEKQRIEQLYRENEGREYRKSLKNAETASSGPPHEVASSSAAENNEAENQQIDAEEKYREACLRAAQRLIRYAKLEMNAPWIKKVVSDLVENCSLPAEERGEKGDVAGSFTSTRLDPVSGLAFRTTSSPSSEAQQVPEPTSLSPIKLISCAPEWGRGRPPSITESPYNLEVTLSSAGASMRLISGGAADMERGSSTFESEIPSALIRDLDLDPATLRTDESNSPILGLKTDLDCSASDKSSKDDDARKQRRAPVEAAYEEAEKQQIDAGREYQRSIWDGDAATAALDDDQFIAMLANKARSALEFASPSDVERVRALELKSSNVDGILAGAQMMAEMNELRIRGLGPNPHLECSTPPKSSRSTPEPVVSKPTTRHAPMAETTKMLESKFGCSFRLVTKTGDYKAISSSNPTSPDNNIQSTASPSVPTPQDVLFTENSTTFTKPTPETSKEEMAPKCPICQVPVSVMCEHEVERLGWAGAKGAEVNAFETDDDLENEMYDMEDEFDFVTGDGLLDGEEEEWNLV